MLDREEGNEFWFKLLCLKNYGFKKLEVYNGMGSYIMIVDCKIS